MPNVMLSGDALNDTSVITPRIGVTPGSVNNAGALQNQQESEQAKSAMTDQLFNAKYQQKSDESTAGRMAKYIAAGGIDLADMATSSLTFGGVDRGAIWQSARAMGLNGIANFAAANPTGTQMTSGLVGAVVTAGVADAYLVPALSERLAASTFLQGSSLWRWGSTAISGAKAAAQDSAAAAAYDGTMMSVLGTSGGRQLLAARATVGIGKALVSESAAALATRTNQSMWSDDTSTNVALFGLGIVGAGGIAALGARREIRQIANSDAIQTIRTGAADPYGRTAVRADQPTEAEMKAMGPTATYKESTNFTNLMLQARQEPPTSAAGTILESKIRNEAGQVRLQANDSLQKITRPGIEGIPNSGFSLSDPTVNSAASHLSNAANADPTMLNGFDSLGVVADPAEAIAVRDQYVAGLKGSKDVKDIRQARILESQEPLILINGAMMPATKEMNEVAAFVPQKLQLTPTTRARGNYEFNMKLQSGKTVKVSEGGNIPNVLNLSMPDLLQTADGLNAVAEKMIKAGQDFVLPKNPNFIQMDFASHFDSLGGVADVTSVAGFKDLSEVAVASAAAKAPVASNLARGGNLGFAERMKLNLPLPSSLERIHGGNGDTLIPMLDSAAKAPAGSLTASNLSEIRTQLMDINELRDGVRSKPAAIQGDIFRFNRDAKGNWQQPVLGFASVDKTNPALLGTRQGLEQATAEGKAFVFDKLRNGDFSKGLAEGLIQSPDVHTSMALTGLAEDTITGSGSAFSQGVGTVLTREMRYRDNPIMLAALKVAQAVNHLIDNYTNAFMGIHFNGIQNELSSVANRGSKSLVDEFFSHAGGWDIEKDAIPGGSHGWEFSLSNTANNEARLGRKVNPQDVVMNPHTGRSVSLDDKAMEYVNSFQGAAKSLRKDANAVRSSRGLTPINEKNWYVPPPNLKGKIIGFTFDANGNAVPGGAVIASSQAEFDGLRAARMAEIQSAGNGHYFHSQSEIESLADLWDHSQMGFIDPGFLGATSGKQTGSIFTGRMNPHGMEDSIEWVTGRIKAVGQGTVRALYDQPLAIARARSATESAVAGVTNGSVRRNIWDEWEATILGKPLSSVKPGAGTGLIKSAEALSQSLINSGWPVVQAIGASQATRWLNDLGNRLGIRINPVKSFDQLVDQLGPHTPYANAMDYAERTMRVNVPPEIRKMTAGLNRLTASLVLRWFEFPNAAMNMLGVVTNMPSILQSPGTPLMGSIAAGTSAKIGVVDAYKMLAGGFKDMLSATSHPDWNHMVLNGDTTQSVAELNKHLALINSRGSFMKVLAGDPGVTLPVGRPKTAQEFKDFIAHKGIDGLVSLATDTTESMSRSWTHFVGLRLADANGIVGMEARHSFARDVANQAIANYNPLNKPELYQSSFGSMLGLFTSYAQQYNQRLFRWAEQGDYRSIGRQLAVQSALFGAGSVPAYNTFDWLYTGHGENPEATLTDAIYAKYGPMVGSVVAHGGIQEITKLFGMDTGVALYSRGDANVRSPSLDPTKMAAGLNTLKSITGLIWDTGSAMASAATGDDSMVTARYISESLARNMPNRAMKGFMTVMFNGGQDTDASGQIVSDTQNWLESALRVSGLRSTRQDGEVSAYYSNTAQRRRMAARMDVFRNETRSALRSSSPPDMASLFKGYTDAGGSPTHFSTWIREQAATTDSTRGMNQLKDAMKSPSMQMEAWRYEMMK